MRPAAFVLGVLACLAALVTAPAGWVATQVASEDGFVSFAEPLARDAEFREASADYMAAEIAATAGVPSALQPAAGEAIAAAGAAVSGREGYVEAWNETIRRSHRTVFGDVRALSPEQSNVDRFTIDLGPLAAFVVDEVTGSLPVPIEPPDELLVPVQGNRTGNLVERVNSTPGLAIGGLVVIVGLAGLAVVLSRRRSAAVAGLGVGALGVAGLLKLISDQAIPDLVARNTPPSPYAATLQELLVDRTLASFDRWLVWIAILGAVAVAVGMAGRVLAGGRTSSSGP